MQPKKRTLFSRSLRHPKPATRRCKQCGTSLTGASNGRLYCDKVCRDEYAKKVKLARRPKDLRCAFCQKQLDPLSRNPYRWKAKTQHFCDTVCVDAYRRANGHYEEMSVRGNEVVQEYKEKHGVVQNYEHRAASVSAANQATPPKAKYFKRSGKVWGYDVDFFPNEAGDGYDASVVGLEELGVIHCKTVKEGLRMIRQKFVESRQS